LFSSLSCILVNTKKNDDFYINNFTYTKNSENRKELLDYETEVCGINYTNRQLIEKLRLALNKDYKGIRFYNVNLQYSYNLSKGYNCLRFSGEY